MKFLQICLLLLTALPGCGPGEQRATGVVESDASFAGHQFGATTPREEIGRYLDTALRAGPGGSASTRSIVALLSENAPAYRGRGAQEVAQLRGYAFWTLGELGAPPEAIEAILAELSQGHEPYLIAAAAKAAGSLGSRASASVPLLTRCLTADARDEELSFEALDPRWPYAKPTTLRLEAVRALSRIGPDAASARPLLQELLALSDSAEGPMSLALRNAVGEALSATSGSEKSRLAASPPTLDKWIPRSARKQSILDETLAMDQEENEFRLSAFRGRPVALTFYYTRCDNPNKCSVAVTRMAELRQSLDSRGMRSSVLLALVTYDPDFDSPQRMLRFAESRGGKLDQHMLSLRLSDVAAVERFVDAMGAAASFGRGHVAAHSADLILLDREGRVASTHRGMSWDVSRVADDLRRLARE